MKYPSYWRRRFIWRLLRLRCWFSSSFRSVRTSNLLLVDTLAVISASEELLPRNSRISACLHMSGFFSLVDCISVSSVCDSKFLNSLAFFRAWFQGKKCSSEFSHCPYHYRRHSRVTPPPRAIIREPFFLVYSFLHFSQCFRTSLVTWNFVWVGSFLSRRLT